MGEWWHIVGSRISDLHLKLRIITITQAFLFLIYDWRLWWCLPVETLGLWEVKHLSHEYWVNPELPTMRIACPDVVSGEIVHMGPRQKKST